MTYRIPVLVFALLVLRTPGAMAQSDIVLDYPDESPVDLGAGWDTRRGRRSNTVCIEFSVGQDSDERKWQDSGIFFDIVRSKGELAQALTKSTSGSVEYYASKFSASSSFTNESTFSSESVTAAVRAHVKVAPQYVAPAPSGDTTVQRVGAGPVLGSNQLAVGSIRLAKKYLDMLRDNPDSFFSECGNAFVSVIDRGARIVGTLEFQNVERKRRDEFKQTLELSFSYGPASGGVSDQLKQEMKMASQRSELKIRFKGYGGFAKDLPRDEAGLNNAIDGLREAAAKGPRPFSMVLTFYDALPSFRSIRTFVPRDITGAYRLVQIRQQILDLQDHIRESVRSERYPKVFDTTTEKLRKLEKDLDERRRVLETQINNCVGLSCDVENLRDWDDYVYLTQLPVPVLLRDIDPSNAPGKLLDGLVEARHKYWILETEEFRKRLDDSQRLSLEKLEGYKKMIRENILKSFK